MNGKLKKKQLRTMVKFRINPKVRSLFHIYGFYFTHTSGKRYKKNTMLLNREKQNNTTPNADLNIKCLPSKRSHIYFNMVLYKINLKYLRLKYHTYYLISNESRRYCFRQTNLLSLSVLLIIK